MEIIIPIFCVIIIISGLAILYFINRRKFNRTNVAGLQQFSNYEKAVGVTFLERLGKIIARLLIIAGAFFLLLYYMANKKTDLPKENPQTNIKDK